MSFLVPVFFLPAVFGDAIGIPKLMILLLGNVVVLLLWAYEVYRSNSLRLSTTVFDMPLLGLAVAYLAGSIFASPNTIGSLLSPTGAGSVLMLVMFYILAVQTKGVIGSKSTTHSLAESEAKLPIARLMAMISKSDNPLMSGLQHSALLIAVWSIVNVSMKLAEMSYSFTVSGVDIQFPLIQLSPMGDLIAQTVFLVIMLTYVLSTLSGRSVYSYVKLAILLLGVAGSGYVLSQTSPFPLLPFRYGWVIAIETFKNAPIFGVGPENFITAFTRYKPTDINASDYWNATFNFSSNMYLHLLTTVGILGLSAYLLLVQRVYKLFKQGGKDHKGLLRIILGIVLIQLVVPFSMPLLFVEVVLLLTYAVKKSTPASKIKLIKVTENE